MKGTTVNLSPRVRNILAGMKRKKEHKNMDSALREIIMRSDVDEEELIQIAKEADDYKQPNSNEDADESDEETEQSISSDLDEMFPDK